MATFELTECFRFYRMIFNIVKSVKGDIPDTFRTESTKYIVR